MIVLNEEIVVDNEETLDLFLEAMQEYVYNDVSKQTYNIFKKYLHECFDADVRLTQMTQDKLGNDIYPLVFINLGECDDLNAFNFSLTSENENREVKFIEEKQYYSFCDICFGHIQGLFDRIFIHFNE